ncbi:argininosuccinate lyase [Devosia sp. 2618]|uniref:argininosuccinate lyase n=1 Tax=Devosia sp. 2618 TaxID=3156454 RepID=UPI003396BE5C
MSKTIDDGTRFGFSSKPKAAEISELSRYSGPLYSLPDVTFDHQVDLHVAHALMLHKQSILTQSETVTILEGVFHIAHRAQSESNLKGYMAFENALVEHIGLVGGKLHIGRSRDDMANVYNRMFYRARINALSESIDAFRTDLVGVAKAHLHTPMMVYTHTRQAQPITYAHYLMAHVEAFGKHHERYESLYNRVNQNPLGAAASAGTTWPLDRRYTTRLLGFDSLVVNTVEGVAGWDHIAEFSGANAILMAGLSRLALEMTFWQTDEFGLIELDGAFTGSSSIMPHKKNPNVLEHVRSMASKALADHTGIISSLISIPYQHTSTRHVLGTDSLDGVSASIAAMAGAIRTATPKVARMMHHLQDSFAAMTNLADILVKELGISFREAHDIVGDMVVDNVEHGKNIALITPQLVNVTASRVLGKPVSIATDRLLEALDIVVNIANSDLEGGPAPSAVQSHICEVENDISASSLRRSKREERLADAAADRKAECLALGIRVP